MKEENWEVEIFGGDKKVDFERPTCNWQGWAVSDAAPKRIWRWAAPYTSINS